MCCINNIMSDRIISDVWDEYQNKPSTSFKIYVSEWFLSRFGSKEISEILLQDFILALKKYCKLSYRYQLFVDYCQLNELLDPENIDISDNYYAISKNRFKKLYFQTDEAVRIHNRLAYLVKNTEKKSFITWNEFQPIFPNINVRGLDLISSEILVKLWDTV